MTQAILHSDLNSFYASVETMLDPTLKGRAIAVCGSTESRHGIVLAKSELAKKAGVTTGMVNWEARQKCPSLILVAPHYDQYLKYSKLVRSIYLRYTDLVEPFGMDECWCDVTGSISRYGSAMDIAEEIRQHVKKEAGMTVSIGVSFCKVFAKLGSDMKKPDAITEISHRNFRSLIWPLPASDLLYVGRATSAKLSRYGIHTIGDLAAADPVLLKRLLGVNGIALWRYACGTDCSRVMHRDYISPIKSIGHGITCTADLNHPEEVWVVLLELAQDVGHRLRVHELTARGVQISLRWSDLSWKQCQCKLPMPSRSPKELAQAAFRLFLPLFDPEHPLRAVTIRATDLTSCNIPVQLDLYSDFSRRERLERLDDTVDYLRDRYGKTSIRAASLLGDLKMPDDGRDQVTMPAPMYK